MKNPQILKTLLIMLMIMGAPIPSLALDVGDKAPNFSGVSTLGTVRLSDALGKQNVVLALYFAVFTPV
jgi:hypothetical protein